MLLSLSHHHHHHHHQQQLSGRTNDFGTAFICVMGAHGGADG